MSDNLLHNVTLAICKYAADTPEVAARAAIAAVAEWLGENGKPYEAAALRAAAGVNERGDA